MRLGISVNMSETTFGRFGNERFEKIRACGFSCVDYNIMDTDTSIYTAPYEKFEKCLKKEKQLANSAGIEIFQTHGPWRWPPKDQEPADRQNRLQNMQRAVVATSLLGSKYMVLHPLMPYGVDDVLAGNAQKTKQVNEEFIIKLLETAKEHDVTLCLENMPFRDFSLSVPCDILDFVKKIGDEHLKICLDIGHIASFENLNAGDQIKALGDFIKVLHVHDSVPGLDLHLMPCYGATDWNGVIGALKEINFSGVFSLETAPSGKLPDDIFVGMCTQLAEIANYIVNRSNSWEQEK